MTSGKEKTDLLNRPNSQKKNIEKKHPQSFNSHLNVIFGCISTREIYLSEGPAVLLNICLGLKNRNSSFGVGLKLPPRGSSEAKFFLTLGEPLGLGGHFKIFCQKMAIYGVC